MTDNRSARVAEPDEDAGVGHAAAVNLYWLPLEPEVDRSAERTPVRSRAAWLGRRPRLDLYHSALIVTVPDGDFVIEMAPIPDGDGSSRGVVAEGPVGTRWVGPLRIFRYEIRRWRGGAIPDVAEAVESPRLVSDDPALAQRLLELVPLVPTLVWGRDEVRDGRDVELELAHLMASRVQRRRRVGTPSASGWARPRLASGSRDGSPRAARQSAPAGQSRRIGSRSDALGVGPGPRFGRSGVFVRVSVHGKHDYEQSESGKGGLQPAERDDDHLDEEPRQQDDPCGGGEAVCCRRSSQLGDKGGGHAACDDCGQDQARNQERLKRRSVEPGARHPSCSRDPEHPPAEGTESDDESAAMSKLLLARCLADRLIADR